MGWAGSINGEQINCTRKVETEMWRKDTYMAGIMV
jgi:hypothetical protein